MKFAFDANGGHIVLFIFFIGVLQSSENNMLLFPRVCWNHIILLLVVLKEMRTLANCFSYILECMGSILDSSFWVTAKLLVTRISPIYLVDKVIFLFLVLLKEMRLLDEYTTLHFLFLVLIKEMRTCRQSKISLCNLRVGRLFMRPASGVM